MLKFCYVSATGIAYSKGIFVAATNSANQTMQAVCAINQSIFLKCLWSRYNRQDKLQCV
jgi:hypothetical protein